MANSFAHTELSTPDVPAAKAFFSRVFDWQFGDVAAGPSAYTMVSSGGRGIGGIQAKHSPDEPTAWLPYVEVADVGETLAKVVANGGVVVLESHDIGPHGTVGVFRDPTGAVLGVWSPPPKPEAPESELTVKAKPKKTAEEREGHKKAKKAEKQARKAAKKAEAKRRAEEKKALKAREKAEKAAAAQAPADPAVVAERKSKAKPKAAAKKAPAKRSSKKSPSKKSPSKKVSSKKASSKKASSKKASSKKAG